MISKKIMFEHNLEIKKLYLLSCFLDLFTFFLDENSLLFLGFSDEFEEKMNALDDEYVDHVGVEHVARQMIERNLEELADETMDQTELLKAIGFSEIGASRFSNFVDDSVAHLSFSNWLDLYVEKLFAPKDAITASNFPFQEETVNSPFFYDCSPKAGGNTLTLINFTSKKDLDDWIRSQTDPFRIQQFLTEGKLIHKFVFLNYSFQIPDLLADNKILYKVGRHGG
jgi:hypothetical protein